MKAPYYMREDTFDAMPGHDLVDYECVCCRDVVEDVYDDTLGRRSGWGPERTCTACNLPLCRACAHEDEFCPACRVEIYPEQPRENVRAAMVPLGYEPEKEE